MRRTKRVAVDRWEQMVHAVGVPCPARPGERGLVVGFVQRLVPSEGPSVAELLVAGDHVLATFPHEAPLRWTWLELDVACVVPTDRDRHVPGQVEVVDVRGSCPAEAPEWSVRRSLRWHHRPARHLRPVALAPTL